MPSNATVFNGISLTPHSTGFSLSGGTSPVELLIDVNGSLSVLISGTPVVNPNAITNQAGLAKMVQQTGKFWLGDTIKTAGPVIANSIQVTSTTAVTNLNADQVDGYHATSFTLKNDSSKLYELKSNKVTSLSGASTDIQYPSAKYVYEQLAGKQDSGSYLVAADITGKVDKVNGKALPDNNFTDSDSIALVNLSGNLAAKLDSTKATYAMRAAWTAKEPALGNPGVNGYILSKSTAGVVTWIPPGGGGGGTWTSQSIITANTNAVKDVLYILAGTLTLTLPAAPSVGDNVFLKNKSETITAIVARNGLLIEKLAEDLTVDRLNVFIQLNYTGTVYGWIII
jgi:hypothetical protein